MASHRSPSRPADSAPESALSAVRAHLAAGRIAEGRRAAEDLGERHPTSPAVLRLRGEAAEAAGDWPAALEFARQAVELRPRNVRARLRLVRVLWRMGQVEEALDLADHIAKTAVHRPGALARVGACYADLGLNDPALRCLQQALDSRPDDPVLLAAVADSAAALGQFTVATAHAERALFRDPGQLSLLERRTRWDRQAPASTDSPGHDSEAATRERVNQLGFQLDRLPPDDPRRAPVCYALASELEALGHPEPAFGIWREGARCRLLALSDDGREERARLLEATESFDTKWFTTQPVADGGAGRIFLTGLPGSGLSWLARRLAHVPGVEVQYDTGFLARALTLASSERDRETPASGPSGGAAPAGRWTRLARLGPGDWRDHYLASSRALASWRDPSRPPAVTVDVDTAHLGALGLIRAAFPAAKIIHLRRDPLDHCLALFTTLFPAGRAWSYDLHALTRHYAAYHHLVGHWRRHLPEGLVDLDVEDVVACPEEVMARVDAAIDAGAPDPADRARPPLPAGLQPGRAGAYTRQLVSVVERLRADGVPVR